MLIEFNTFPSYYSNIWRHLKLNKKFKTLPSSCNYCSLYYVCILELIIRVLQKTIQFENNFT